jgi:hypothetical protein
VRGRLRGRRAEDGDADRRLASRGLRRDWKFWLDLPTTPKEYSRIDNLDEKIGALETLLLDKHNYNSMNCGDGACLGCGEKTAIHMFTGTVTALMQPRVEAFVEKLDDLISGWKSTCACASPRA